MNCKNCGEPMKLIDYDNIGTGTCYYYECSNDECHTHCRKENDKEHWNK